MKRTIIRSVVLALNLLCSTVLVSAQIEEQGLTAATEGETDARIKGVSQFLLKRANDNFFYLMETRIKENDYLKNYFPDTYRYAASGDLKSLLRSTSSIWQEVVREDIEYLGKRAMLNFFVEKGWDKKMEDLHEKYLELMSKTQITIDGKSYPLNANLMPNEPNAAKVNKIINKFHALAEPYNKVIEFKKEQYKITSKECSNDDDKCIQYSSLAMGEKSEKKLDDHLQHIDNIIALSNRTHEIETSLRENASVLTINGKSLQASDNQYIEELLGKLRSFEGHIEYYKFVQAKLREIKATRSFLLKVIMAEEILKEGNKYSPPVFQIHFDSAEYHRFRRFIVFFAEVADARDSDKVVALLDEITLPPVSFGLKRTVGESDWMITAYLGAAAGVEDSTTESGKSFGGMFAPLGVEYTFRKKHKSSWSIMLAPFDFAYPINLEVADQSEPVDLSDVVIPGVYLSYGWEDAPITTGIGFSKGRALRTEANNESRIMLFIAFDMPLFAFH